ncbi:MAG TPA: Rrf2 family transcriptional regulator [Candidatus Binatia bacterium]|nr:Rrf2 family transcriptional regulator [Candidatus Binatia bacterium]
MGVMQIPRRVDYGLRAMIYLATQNPERSCSVSEIASQQNVPRKFLEKIIRDLIRCGLVKSKRGPDGGYTLTRSPREISFRDVIEALEGPIAVNVCMDQQLSCSHLPRCAMFGVWNEVQRRIIEVFANTTLADLQQVPGQARLNSSSLSSAA